MSQVPPPPPYSQTPYPGGGDPYPGPRGDAKNATTALVLGIVSLVVCSILGPVALILGRNAMKEVDASGGALGGRGKAQAGFILGIVASVLLVIGLIAVIAVYAGGN